jgi:hypothetical protein
MKGLMFLEGTASSYAAPAIVFLVGWGLSVRRTRQRGDYSAPYFTTVVAAAATVAFVIPETPLCGMLAAGVAVIAVMLAESRAFLGAIASRRRRRRDSAPPSSRSSPPSRSSQPEVAPLERAQAVLGPLMREAFENLRESAFRLLVERKPRDER